MRNRAISQVGFRFSPRVGRARLQRATLVGYAARGHFAAHEEPEFLAEDLGSFSAIFGSERQHDGSLRKLLMCIAADKLLHCSASSRSFEQTQTKPRCSLLVVAC